MDIRIPAGARQILEQLQQHGYAAYLVGGCVRDSLLGGHPEDWDIATSACPQEVKGCFPGVPVLETGLAHGTVTVCPGDGAYEVTTFRVDGAYTDFRRPDTVSFTSELAHDLARRDFTINALAWNPREGLVDLFGGQQDLRQRRIACVGNPALRFGEDALRVLRAVRFASALDFHIEPATARAVRAAAPLLQRVAPERLRTELDKALLGPGVERVFQEYPEVITQVLPELAPCVGFEQKTKYHHLDVWQHSLCAVALAPQQLPVRLALLLHDCAKPHCFTLDAEGIGHCYGHGKESAALAHTVLARLRYDNETRACVENLVLHHDAVIAPTLKAVRRWLNRVGEQELGMLLAVKRADCGAHAPWCAQRGIEMLDEIKQLMQQILAEQQCFRLQDLAVKGGDLLRLGATQGPQLGALLRALLEEVLEERLPNDREVLLRAAAEMLPFFTQ